MNKLLLDTHTILWVLSDDARLSTTARELYEGTEEVFFSMVSLWEIGIKLGLKRSDFTLAPNWWRDIPSSLLQQGVNRMNVEPIHCEAVSVLPHHHRDPFDRLLIAQAISENCSILSIDVQFDAYPVDRLW